MKDPNGLIHGKNIFTEACAKNFNTSTIGETFYILDLASSKHTGRFGYYPIYFQKHGEKEDMKRYPIHLLGIKLLMPNTGLEHYPFIYKRVMFTCDKNMLHIFDEIQAEKSGNRFQYISTYQNKKLLFFDINFL